MAAAASIAQTFGSLHRPVRIPKDETWLTAATWSRASAETRMRDIVLPHLTHRDDEGQLHFSPRLLYVPFWRVKLAVAGIHLSPSARTIAIANIEFPMPVPSFGGRAGVLMICARTVVPYTPRLPSFFGGTDALEVQRSELVPFTNETALPILEQGEIIDADVDRERGQKTAAGTLITMLQRPDAVHSLFQPRIESTTFVLYPLWYSSFGNDGHFVMLSARGGNVVSARYPRPPTLSERVKRFFTP